MVRELAQNGMIVPNDGNNNNNNRRRNKGTWPTDWMSRKRVYIHYDYDNIYTKQKNWLFWPVEEVPVQIRYLHRWDRGQIIIKRIMAIAEDTVEILPPAWLSADNI